MLVERFQKLKEAVESLRRKADRASGVKEQILSQLRKEFGVRTLEEAEKLLLKEEKGLEKEEEALEEELETYKGKWGDLLGET